MIDSAQTSVAVEQLNTTLSIPNHFTLSKPSRISEVILQCVKYNEFGSKQDTMKEGTKLQDKIRATGDRT